MLIHFGWSELQKHHTATLNLRSSPKFLGVNPSQPPNPTPKYCWANISSHLLMIGDVQLLDAETLHPIC